jgi:hypothetical protein
MRLTDRKTLFFTAGDQITVQEKAAYDLIEGNVFIRTSKKESFNAGGGVVEATDAVAALDPETIPAEYAAYPNVTPDGTETTITDGDEVDILDDEGAVTGTGIASVEDGELVGVTVAE